MKDLMNILCALIMLCILGAVCFGVVAGFAWLICWCFGFNFSLKATLGVCLLVFLVCSATHMNGGR